MSSWRFLFGEMARRFEKAARLPEGRLKKRKDRESFAMSKGKIPTFDPVSLTKDCRLTFLSSRLSSSILCIFSCSRWASRWFSYSIRRSSSFSRSFASRVDRLNSERNGYRYCNGYPHVLVYPTVYESLGFNCLSFLLTNFILNSGQLIFFRPHFSFESYF